MAVLKEVDSDEWIMRSGRWRGDEGLRMKARRSEIRMFRQKDSGRKNGSSNVPYQCRSPLHARQWCMSHPKDGFLFPSCPRSTPVVPSSYSHPAGVLRASYWRPALRNRLKTWGNGGKRANRKLQETPRKKSATLCTSGTCKLWEVRTQRSESRQMTGNGREWRGKKAHGSMPQAHCPAHSGRICATLTTFEATNEVS